MRLKEDFNQMTVQETPGCLWLFGLFFAIIGGVFVYGALGGFVNYRDVPSWQIGLTLLMGAAAVIAGVWIAYRAPVTKVIISRRDRTVSRRTFGLSGKRRQDYTFDDLKGFILIEEADIDNDPIWSLGMERTDGEIIKISAMPNHSIKFKRDFVFRINGFMDKQLPSYQTFGALEDESEPKIS